MSTLELTEPLTLCEQAIVGSLSHISSALLELAKHHDQNMSWPYSENGMARLAVKMVGAMASAAGDPLFLRPRVTEKLMEGLVTFQSEAEDAESVEEFIGWLRRATGALASVEEESAAPPAPVLSGGFMLNVLNDDGDSLACIGPFPTEREAQDHRAGLPLPSDIRIDVETLTAPSSPELRDQLQEILEDEEAY